MDSSPAVSPRLLNETGQKEASFKCSSPGCSKTFGRRQELDRHIIYDKHIPNLPNSICCRQAGCNWTGDRLETLHNHLRNRHPGIPAFEKERYMIYDASGLVKQIWNKKITMKRAEFLAHSLFNNWALESTLMISVG